MARREALIAEWLGWREAWLDVWAYGVLEISRIAVCHPRVDGYHPGAAETESLCTESDRVYRGPAPSSLWLASWL